MDATMDPVMVDPNGPYTGHRGSYGDFLAARTVDYRGDPIDFFGWARTEGWRRNGDWINDNAATLSPAIGWKRYFSSSNQINGNSSNFYSFHQY